MVMEDSTVGNCVDIEQTVKAAAIASDIGFTVFGEPETLLRHRTLHTGVTYNPSAAKQKLFRESAKMYMPLVPLEGPLEINIRFYFARPKSHYGLGRNCKVIKPSRLEKWHYYKKDLDNLVKFVLDALNKLAYMDDCQISVISAAKLYANVVEESRVEVMLRKLSSTDDPLGGNFRVVLI